jgi:methylmalonyl-CoA mutase C-terminal domain/subunit
MSRPGIDPPARILITKIGLDGHDRGSRVVAAFLRDAGMEVIYTPPWQAIAHVVQLAEDEDVDAIGISSLATDHLLMPKLLKALAKAGLAHLPVVVGGIVPDADEGKLKKAGVRHVFHPGASREEIVHVMARLAVEARAAKTKSLLGRASRWQVRTKASSNGGASPAPRGRTRNAKA